MTLIEFLRNFKRVLYFVWKGLDPFGYFLSVGTSRGLLKPPVSVPEEKEGGGGV